MKKSLKNSCSCGMKGGCSPLYGLGFLGSLVYFVQNSNGLMGFLFAIVKAIIWPALVAYELLKFLQV